MTDPAKDAERLAENAAERRLFDASNTALALSPLRAVAACLAVWPRMAPGGSQREMMAIFSNECAAADATIALLTQERDRAETEALTLRNVAIVLTEQRDEALRELEAEKEDTAALAENLVKLDRQYREARCSAEEQRVIADQAQAKIADLHAPYWPAASDGLTPRLRALSIANQHASLFTSAGAREQVTKSIEEHIIAACRELSRLRGKTFSDAQPAPDDVEPSRPFVEGAQSAAEAGVPMKRCAATTAGELYSTSKLDDVGRARRLVENITYKDGFIRGNAEKQLAAALTAARREGAELRALDEAVIEAARPFIEAADNLEDETRDNSEIWEAPAAMSITAGMLRNLQRALAARDDANDGEGR